MARRVTRALILSTLALSSLGCGSWSLNPTLDPRPVPVAVRDRWPLRAAILIPDEERNRTYRSSIEADIRTIETNLPLGAGLEEILPPSLAPLFERIVIVRSRPAAGAYDMVLVPKIADIRWKMVVVDRLIGLADLSLAISGQLQILDGTGKELTTIKADGTATARRLGGQANVWEQRTGEVAAQALVSLVRRWGEQAALSFDLEQYAARVRPAVTAQAPAGSPPRPPSDITISFSYPTEGARLSEDDITVMGLVSASKEISRIDLVVNGRPLPVSRDVRVQPTGIQSHPFNAKVPLTPGLNLIAVTVVDRSGAAAQAVRTVFRDVAQPTGGPTATAKLGTGERWAVVIGIDQYRDPSISSLRYAAADAESVFRFLMTRGGVKPSNARLLLNQQATQRAIREVLGGFLRQKATKDDEVVIYYAGHGTTEPDQSAESGVAKYLVPWDADPTNLFASAIPMEEIDRVFGRLAARKILMVQDTCFSGGAGGRTFLAKGLAMRSTTLTDRFLQDLSQKEGRMILTASDVNQISQEDPALGHGIFTHFLLEALGGAADLDGDGAITVREVHLYLQRKVHERSNGAQTPQLYNIGDMTLVRK